MFHPMNGQRSLYKVGQSCLQSRSSGEGLNNLVGTAVCPVKPSAHGQRGQRAGRQTANTHARKGMPGRHPGRLQVAILEPSKRCSRMPIIGLVRLRRALEGATPSFDPIPAGTQPAGRWATRKRRQAGNGLTTCYRVKAGAVRLGGRAARAQPVPHT